jgi:hypothetical protein
MNDNLLKILKDSLFFTGAGFSKPAGCYLSAEMLKDIEEKSFNDNREIFTKIERKAIKFILSCLDYQARYRTLESDGKYSYSPNIEEFAQLLRRIKNRENLLPYPITGNWSDKIVMIEQEFLLEDKNPEMDIWSSIEFKIKTRCYKNWLKIENTEYLKPFEQFLSSINNQEKIEIFTLNNDLVLETHFKDENIVYTGFVSNKWVGFERENINNESTFNNSKINYYKLHGSIDWFKTEDGTVRRGNNNENTPFLIFGQGTKIYTIDPFFSLLEYFKQSLKKKKYFFAIGYSFFDPHINNLIFNELLLNDDKYLIILNPKIDGLFDVSDFEQQFGIKNVLKDSVKKNLVKFFNNIQQNSIYSEMPDFNVKKISPDSFEFIQNKAEKFIKDFENYLNFVYELINEKRKSRELF